MGEAYWEKLAEMLGSSFDAEVQRKMDSFGGLLTRTAAVRMLCQENGISTEEKILLKDARASLLPFSFSARVDRVFPVQQFPGGLAKSVRLHISDGPCARTLVLWNEQASLAAGLLAGDRVECSGAYFRSGEIAIGRKGTLSRAGARAASSVAGLREGMCSVEGKVEGAEGMRSYRDRKTGEGKRMYSFSISSGGKSCRAVWWSPPDGAALPRAGDSVALENANFRAGELHLNSGSRVLVQGASGGTEGIFQGAFLEGGSVAIRVGGQGFALAPADALSLLGIGHAPSGVSPQALISIKSRALEGKKASCLVEGGRLVSLKFEG